MMKMTGKERIRNGCDEVCVETRNAEFHHHHQKKNEKKKMNKRKEMKNPIATQQILFAFSRQRLDLRLLFNVHGRYTQVATRINV